MKADTIKAALSTTAMKTPRNDMALSSSIIQNQGRFPLNRPRTRGYPGGDGSLISARPGASRARSAERLRCLAGGSAHCIRNFATFETQGLEKLNVTHLQRLAKSRVRVHIPLRSYDRYRSRLSPTPLAASPAIFDLWSLSAMRSA